MSASKPVRIRIAVEVVVAVLSLSALYCHFLADDDTSAFYLATASLYFYGIAFIVNAIAAHKQE
jgi:hypothetical protein